MKKQSLRNIFRVIQNFKNGHLKGGLISSVLFSCIVFADLNNLSEGYLDDFTIIKGENGPLKG